MWGDFGGRNGRKWPKGWFFWKNLLDPVFRCFSVFFGLAAAIPITVEFGGKWPPSAQEKSWGKLVQNDREKHWRAPKWTAAGILINVYSGGEWPPSYQNTHERKRGLGTILTKTPKITRTSQKYLILPHFSLTTWLTFLSTENFKSRAQVKNWLFKFTRFFPFFDFFMKIQIWKRGGFFLIFYEKHDFLYRTWADSLLLVWEKSPIQYRTWAK